MNQRFRSRVSILLIAMLLFAQASVAVAACIMDRGSLAPMLEMSEGCGDCQTELKSDAPQYANRCVAHCTSDLQLSGGMIALVRSPADPPVLLLPSFDRFSALRSGLESPPPRSVPHRILLHSFLI
jgi:hypothetical protein